MNGNLLFATAMAFGLFAVPAKSENFEIFTTSKGISSAAFNSIVDDIQKLKSDIKLQANPAIVLPPSDAIMDPRIVGGEITNIETYPWQVALVFHALPEPYRSLRCGGTIIDRHWVLTAAHCVDDNAAQDIVAQTTFYKYLGIRSDVAKIVVHPFWVRGTMENDIALVKITSEMAAQSIVKISQEAKDLPTGVNIYVTGWGAIFEGGPTSDVLRVANMPTVDRTTCNQPGSYNGKIKTSMMCAGLREGGLDSCQGDSGGPAVSMQGGKAVLVGVVSGGDGCARRLKYGVYTQVGHFAPWIQQTIAAN